MYKSKHSKFFIFISILGISLTSIVLANALNSNNISSNKNEINSNNSIINKDANLIKNKVNPQPLSNIDDLKITSYGVETGKISTDEIVDNDGNYILTASNQSGNKAKIVKLNFQMQYLYDWTYNTNGYKTRQIVADTDDIGYFYALLVNENLTISTNNNNKVFDITNPTLVVQLYDTGSSFEQRNVYNLGLPNFSINNKNGITSHLANPSNTITDSEAADNIWDHVYVQEAIQENDDNSRLSFIRSTKTSNSTAKNTSSETNVYINDDSKSVIYKLLGSEGKKNSNSDNNIDQSYYMLKQLYLNNANNMVYLKDNATNTKMILLFGGNAYQSFWFYDFKIDVKGKNTWYVTPLLYSNYDFDPYASKYQDEVEYYGVSERVNSSVLKKYFYLPFMTKNKISNLAWFVGGAKTINIVDEENKNNSSSYVFLALMQPNVTDFNSSLFNNNNSTIVDETIKKGTFATSTEVSSWNRLNKDTTGQAEPAANRPEPKNTNPQKTGTNYDNKEVLVSSSSINASFAELGQVSGSRGSWSTISTNFYYPFSAIQSQMILPIMSSEIAELVCVEPQNYKSDFPQEKIYLNTFSNLPTTENTSSNSLNKFSLFNCIKNRNDNFQIFSFAREMISNPRDWTEDIKDVQAPSDAPDQIIDVGYDSVGLSRILLNKNPKTSSNFFNDGWANTASQKIIGFSPQLSDKKIKTNFGTYNQINAVLIFRGFVYSFTYDYIQPALGSRIVPYANLSNKIRNSIILTDSSSLNKFTNLLSISYFGNNWVLTYQDKNSNKHLCYKITYLPDLDTWDFSLDSILSSSGSYKINKLFVFFQNNFIFLSNDNNSEIQIVNTNTNSINNLNSNSINSNIWGVIKSVDKQYLTDNNLFDKRPSEIINNSDLLKQFIDYSGGWSVVDKQTNTPTEEPIIFNIKSTSSSIEFDVALKFINGRYYSSAIFNSSEYPNIIYSNSLNIPTFSYDGFASLAPWVIPTIISGIVFVVILFSVIGVLVSLSLHKNKKMLQKGFASSNKKIDTLTTAVGSVYKKILVQTKNNKSPQMLRAAAKPGVKNNVPLKSPVAPKPIANPAPKKSI
ncbi:hypothetical protein [Mycoplasmoides pirum]|nr:hypothetical protein [Mycoplasmoides pirum]